MTTEHLETEIDQIVHGDHSDPFHILGAHAVQIPTAGLAIRAFFPEALQAWVVPGDRPGSVRPRPDPGRGLDRGDRGAARQRRAYE